MLSNATSNAGAKRGIHEQSFVSLPVQDYAGRVFFSNLCAWSIDPFVSLSLSLSILSISCKGQIKQKQSNLGWGCANHVPVQTEHSRKATSILAWTPRTNYVEYADPRANTPFESVWVDVDAININKRHQILKPLEHVFLASILGYFKYIAVYPSEKNPLPNSNSNWLMCPNHETSTWKKSINPNNPNRKTDPVDPFPHQLQGKKFGPLFYWDLLGFQASLPEACDLGPWDSRCTS